MPDPSQNTSFVRDLADSPLLMRNATMLLVEDSRYSCEVLRLYCRNLGIRLRRAADLCTAQSHLRLYRPDILMVDLDLPDGRGEALITQMGGSRHRPPLMIATSGDDSARKGAMTAGADLFVEKPMPELLEFRGLLLDHFPTALPLAMLPNRPLRPIADPLALQDDLTLAAKNMGEDKNMPFVSGFVAGVAGSAGDAELHNVAVAGRRENDFRQLREIVAERLRALEGRL